MSLTDLLSSEPDILGGAVVFKGTRVPIDTLFDYIESGQSLNDFLIDFPGVNRNVAIEVLEKANQAVRNNLDPTKHEAAS